MVEECLGEMMLKEAITGLVEEVLYEKKSKKKKKGDSPKTKKTKSSRKGKKASKSKRASLKRQGEFRDLLKDPKIDLAQVGYAVEPRKNKDTVRTKWSKKARGERSFTADEISKGMQKIRQMQN